MNPNIEKIIATKFPDRIPGITVRNRQSGLTYTVRINFKKKRYESPELTKPFAIILREIVAFVFKRPGYYGLLSKDEIQEFLTATIGNTIHEMDPIQYAREMAKRAGISTSRLDFSAENMYTVLTRLQTSTADAASAASDQEYEVTTAVQYRKRRAVDAVNVESHRVASAHKVNDCAQGDQGDGLWADDDPFLYFENGFQLNGIPDENAPHTFPMSISPSTASDERTTPSSQENEDHQQHKPIQPTQTYDQYDEDISFFFNQTRFAHGAYHSFSHTSSSHNNEHGVAALASPRLQSVSSVPVLTYQYNIERNRLRQVSPKIAEVQDDETNKRHKVAHMPDHKPN